MGIVSSFISSAAIEEALEKDYSSRCKLYPVQMVDKVYRFGAAIGSRIDEFQRLGRGMDLARRLIAEYDETNVSFPDGIFIRAGELSGGKGRFQRIWHAPPGGLWATLILVNTLLPQTARQLPLAAGVACCEALREYIPEVAIKWVNDVHLHSRKIAGILAETCRGRIHGEEYILIGLGINVNNSRFPDELSGLAVSISEILGRQTPVEEMAAVLIAKLRWNVGLLHYQEQRILEEKGSVEYVGGEPVNRKDEFALLIRNWLQLSDSIGRRVRFGHDVRENPQYEAEVVGIDAGGALILRHLRDNVLITENSGELVYLN